MKELKRIFGNRRLTLCLLLVFLINGILFLGAAEVARLWP